MESDVVCSLAALNAYDSQPKSLRAVSKADTILNLVGVLGFVLWILFSIATNCLTFKNKKDNEKKD